MLFRITLLCLFFVSLVVAQAPPDVLGDPDTVILEPMGTGDMDDTGSTDNIRVIRGLFGIRHNECPDGSTECVNQPGKCCPTGSDCCKGGGYCKPGSHCYSTGCCKDGYNGCEGKSCCAPGESCCSGGGCCKPGYYCTVVDGQRGCCPNGKKCSCDNTRVCTVPNYSLCPGENFCCPTGDECYRDGNGAPACRTKPTCPPPKY